MATIYPKMAQPLKLKDKIACIIHYMSFSFLAFSSNVWLLAGAGSSSSSSSSVVVVVEEVVVVVIVIVSK